MRLLLISNSGYPLYEWCKQDIADFVGNRKNLTFISAASIFDQNAYFEAAQKSLTEVNLKLNHLILNKNPLDLIEKTDVFIVGGGNTYRLLLKLEEFNLIEPIRKKVLKGTPYLGLSAGANIAGPNILTTNDWNVVRNTNYGALGLVPFNINPHYTDPHDKTIFSGESRDDRIFEYLELHDNQVIAIQERTMLFVDGNSVKLKGRGGKIFRRGQKPRKIKKNTKIQIPTPDKNNYRRPGNLGHQQQI